MSTELMIDVQGVSKGYSGKPVLKDMTFQVNKGAIIGLLGPNGAGKTTMVRLLNGVIQPDGGLIRVGGLDPKEHGDTIRGFSGVVTEGAALYHERSAVENLRFYAKLYGVSGDTRINELLERFGLTEHRDRPVGTFSTGMKKRLALAKALLHKPQLLFLDEPTNGLDPDGVRTVLRTLKELNREEGTTILLCSHVLHQLEELCDGYVFLDQGKIIDAGTLPQIEHKYLKLVELSVETGLDSVQGTSHGSYLGYSYTRTGTNRITFQLPDKGCISKLLAALAEESWVHEAVIVNRSLESLYFAVRKEACQHE